MLTVPGKCPISSTAKNSAKLTAWLNYLNIKRGLCFLCNDTAFPSDCAARSTSFLQSRTELNDAGLCPCRGSYTRRLGLQRSSSKKRRLQLWRKLKLLLKHTRAAKCYPLTQSRTELDDAGLYPERVKLPWELYKKARASEELQQEAPAADLAGAKAIVEAYMRCKMYVCYAVKD